MDAEKLFKLAKPYLEKNDFGMAHTQRVFDIAQENFTVPSELRELTFASIILHDIGGSSIKDQYEKGPEIATSILKQLGCDKSFIQEVRRIIGTHHGHPDNPSLPFRVLYDSDKLVMFSPEEFPHYNSRVGFDWEKIVDLMYSEGAKRLAEDLLKQRRSEA
jgi:predicted metal-dependent HD superfamily phosphohydrolase